ncbi:MAG: recombinase family protein [Chloroflexi bacterium]|nr:recombinase family protein [Chloroflexota bacterium]
MVTVAKNKPPRSNPLTTHVIPPTTIPPGSIVDAYLRDSGGLKQDRSITRQLEALTEYCKQHNFILRTPYQDAAKSGTTTAGRDNFLRMVADYEIPANRPKALLIWNYARFARDVDDSQLYKAIIRKWGVVIHSLTDDVPEGRFGRLIEMLIEISNEDKAKQTAIDASDGLRSIVQQGAMPGTPPAGFKREPILTTNYRTGEKRTNHRWVPDPDWIPRIKQAFAMKAAGASLIQIHNQTHIYTAINSYRTFFQNELYIGILHFGKHTIDGYCPPIIDPETWINVQKILALHAARQHVSSPTSIHPRRKNSATYLLSGISYCAKCKSPLWGMSSGQRDGSYYRRYACTRAKRNRNCDLQPIPAEALEKNVIEKLTAFFEDPYNLQSLLEEDRKYIEDSASKSKALAKDIQKQITALRRSIANITEAIAQRGHSKAMLAKLSDLETQEVTLQSQLNSAKTNIPTSDPPFTEEEIIFFSKRLVSRLQSKDPAIVRNVLLGTIHQVIVDRTPNNIIGIIQIHSPHESLPPPNTPEGIFGGGAREAGGGGIITASISPTPVGALF